MTKMTPDLDHQMILSEFYTTVRAGCVRLSDGGGPFGFDIHVALNIDYLINAYNCDAIIETGCFLGDTTEYFSKMYPNIPVYSVDIDPNFTRFTRERTKNYANTLVRCADSRDFLKSTVKEFSFPLYYLDSHWHNDWPLTDELEIIKSGVVCIDDFDIGDKRFAFDSYDGLACNDELIRGTQFFNSEYFVPNPTAEYPVPCLQVGRRSGVCYGVSGKSSRPMDICNWFTKKTLK